MPNAFPATGSTKSMGRIRKGFFGSKPSAGGNVELRGVLANQIGITSGSVSISSTFGGYYASTSTTDSDN